MPIPALPGVTFGLGAPEATNSRTPSAHVGSRFAPSAVLRNRSRRFRLLFQHSQPKPYGQAWIFARFDSSLCAHPAAQHLHQRSLNVDRVPRARPLGPLVEPVEAGHLCGRERKVEHLGVGSDALGRVGLGQGDCEQAKRGVEVSVCAAEVAEGGVARR